MTTYPDVHDRASLRAAVRDALAQGSGSVVVPMFNGSSHPFDDLLQEGIATSYRLWVEISLSPDGGVK